jgi:hypothetical protein
MNLSKIFYGLATSIVFFILCLYFFHPIRIDIINSDLGRHLLLGQIIFNSGHVPLTNLLSYTNTNFPFINTHWLSEVIFYLWYTAFGFNGLQILSIVLIVSALSLLFFYTCKRFNILSGLLVALIYLQVLSERTEIRPELFSFLFLSIFLFILYHYREKYTRWIYLLIPIEFLWVNLHIYFAIGIVVLFIFLFEVLIKDRHSIKSKKNMTLLGVTLGAGLVTFINPNFINGAFYPLFVFNNYGLTVQENITFFAAVGLYKDPTFLYFEIANVLLWATILASAKKIQMIDVLLSICFTILGFMAIRNFPLFVFGTFIPAVTATSYVWKYISKKYIKTNVMIYESVLFIVIVLLLIPVMQANIDIHGVGFGVSDKSKDAISFITKNNLTGTIYNNFDIGNYLEYQLYPKQKVFVDNRPEAYPTEFFQDIYAPMQVNENLFNQQSNKYHFNILFIDHTDLSDNIEKQLYGLVRNKDWKLVFLNSTIAIFIKNTPQNHSFIQSHEITQNTPINNSKSMQNKTEVRQLSNFYRSVNWPKQQLALYIRYLDFDPTNCVVIRNIAYMLQQQNDPATSFYVSKFQTSCAQ